mmetsp:Transcript_29939/g.100906  ORF Transcript_29939/g.100906 Transcript_29939/m.100906 type:complete len:221 (+) Transcript_29939:194-856(+)
MPLDCIAARPRETSALSEASWWRWSAHHSAMPPQSTTRRTNFSALSVVRTSATSCISAQSGSVIFTATYSHGVSRPRAESLRRFTLAPCRRSKNVIRVWPCKIVKHRGVCPDAIGASTSVPPWRSKARTASSQPIRDAIARGEPRVESPSSTSHRPSAKSASTAPRRFVSAARKSGVVHLSADALPRSIVDPRPLTCAAVVLSWRSAAKRTGRRPSAAAP